MPYTPTQCEYDDEIEHNNDELYWASVVESESLPIDENHAHDWLAVDMCIAHIDYELSKGNVIVLEPTN